MKKAKFVDEFKIIAGACIGHYVQYDKQCRQCKIRQLCIDRCNKKIYPKNQKQVKNIINKYFSEC